MRSNSRCRTDPYRSTVGHRPMERWEETTQENFSRLKPPLEKGLGESLPMIAAQTVLGEGWFGTPKSR